MSLIKLKSNLWLIPLPVRERVPRKGGRGVRAHIKYQRIDILYITYLSPVSYADTLSRKGRGIT
jgi:hypothetical protein